MRISDWSSDVCSSDLAGGTPALRPQVPPSLLPRRHVPQMLARQHLALLDRRLVERIDLQQVRRDDGLKEIVHHQRSGEPTSELQSIIRRSYHVFCLKKKRKNEQHPT